MLPGEAKHQTDTRALRFRRVAKPHARNSVPKTSAAEWEQRKELENERLLVRGVIAAAASADANDETDDCAIDGAWTHRFIHVMMHGLHLLCD